MQSSGISLRSVLTNSYEWLASALSSKFPRRVARAWRDAGAGVGWQVRYDFGGCHFVSAKFEFANDCTYLPAFHCGCMEPDVFATLPAPLIPFAVDLSNSGMTNALLRGLARFKKLRSLDLSRSAVTDAGLNELAPLRRLQHLHLVETRVTDAGMKELAGLAGLLTLDLKCT
jgi:hypothetical protein